MGENAPFWRESQKYPISGENFENTPHFGRKSRKYSHFGRKSQKYFLGGQSFEGLGTLTYPPFIAFSLTKFRKVSKFGILGPPNAIC